MGSYFLHAKSQKYKGRTRVISFRKQYTSFILTLLCFLIRAIFSGGVKINLSVREAKQKQFLNMTRVIFGEHEEFFNYQILIELEKSDFSKCNLCKFPSDVTSTSTKKDIAIGVLFGTNIYNILNWVRTLRSTGCKCSILFFHEENYTNYFNSEELEMLKNCGVVWWSLKTSFYNNTHVDDARTTKYLVIQNFLEAYGNYFNRVLLSDVFDSVFQKDPFIDEIPKDKIAVSIERVDFENHETNTQWVKALDNNFDFDWWRKKLIINSGFEMGYTELVLDLLHTMNQPQYFFAKDTLDQGILNYIYYKGIWTNLSIDYEGKHYISAAYSQFEEISDFDGFIHEVNRPEHTLAVIHQFDRVCPVQRNLLKICPKMGKWHRYPLGRPDYRVQECNPSVT